MRPKQGLSDGGGVSRGYGCLHLPREKKGELRSYELSLPTT